MKIYVYLITLLLALYLSGCGLSRSTQSIETPEGTPANSGVSSIPETSIAPKPSNGNNGVESSESSGVKSSDFHKLTTSDNLSLQIAEKDKPFYKASPEISEKLLGILEKYNEIPSGSPAAEEAGNIDPGACRYILRFDGFKDIYVLEDSKFVFEGKEDGFYESYNFSMLLDALQYMELQDDGSLKTYAGTRGLQQEFTYNSSGESLKTLQRDINGDGKEEKLEIYFDGELALWIDDARYVFDADSELYYVNMQTRQAYGGGELVPDLSLVPTDNEGAMMIVLSFAHTGADNWHQELYTMTYDRGSKFKYYQIEGIPSITSAYENGSLKLAFPGFDFTSMIEFSEQDFYENTDTSPDNDVKPEKYLTGNDLLYLDKPQGFKLVDINSDGEKELLIDTILKRGFKFYICNAEMEYHLSGEYWIPVKITEEKENNALTAEETTRLMTEFFGSDIAENLTFDGQIENTGFYQYSWSNPGKGTGAVWYVNPYTGDVYDFKNDFTGNLIYN